MVATQADAAMIGTEAAVNGDRERVLRLLDHPDVAAQLEAYGVRISDAKARVAALSDAEAAELSAEIDKAYAGAGGGGEILAAPLMLIFAIVLLPFFLLGVLIYSAVTHKNVGWGPSTQSPVHQP